MAAVSSASHSVMGCNSSFWNLRDTDFKSKATILRIHPQDKRFCDYRLHVAGSKNAFNVVACQSTHILVDPKVAYSRDSAKKPDILAYDVIQGALVRWSSSVDNVVIDPPTAVLLHGILGSRKNWGSFARRLAQEFPMWQFLIVDLRCHGDSASIKKRCPHTVASAALDVLKLLVTACST
ncbi:hypothetical protein Syun_014196 [Stephania yunnanensis]|uniref:Uncharacterized protein n=1 Tax=Stephania yunnanensis TaxID=152371 RepID=A0AAP0JJY6_9MAGN